MERETRPELGAHRCQGAGGEERSARGRGTSWLGTQSLGGQRLPGKKGAVVGVACGRESRREEGRQCQEAARERMQSGDGRG